MDTFSWIRHRFEVEIPRGKFIKISSILKGESTWKLLHRFFIDSYNDNFKDNFVRQKVNKMASKAKTLNNARLSLTENEFMMNQFSRTK